MNGITREKADEVLARIARDMAGIDADSDSLAIANRRLLIARLVAKTIPRDGLTGRLDMRRTDGVGGGR